LIMINDYFVFFVSHPCPRTNEQVFLNCLFGWGFL
jgi:hypothetical protein